MSTMKNMPVVDLRTINSVDAVKEIEEMRNIALLILPEDGDPEVLNAIHAIPKRNVASTLTLPKSAKVKQMSGQVDITPAILKQEGILLVAGQGIVTDAFEECNATLIVQGQFIYPKNSPIVLSDCAGQAMAFDYEHHVSFNDDMTIDAEMLDMMEYKTFVLANSDLRFAKDITLDMLKEKKPCFLCNGDVICRKNIAAYLKLNASINGDLKIKGAQYEENEDDDE